MRHEVASSGVLNLVETALIGPPPVSCRLPLR
ncbi:hypothetical protein NK6_9206 [Bradyrhizobium diazoefficiens]|uniref:Uncharacterized protein n=1 Tax=Bradyrhizobium diazoefficiens TaxID=1355477 RepID=A0A0E4FYR8_9BRAD|nr:hypothetical protein NK6_9206 [Bradyrhizobium diazoefficiens]